MKNFTYKNLLEILKSKGVLAISGSVLLVSCGAQMGGYTETDGVYYDPNKDVIPEGIVMQEPGQNVVDEPYNYQSDSVSIIEQNKQNQLAQQNKYRNWSNNNNSQSDWGSYAGTEQNIYYNNYNWGYPYYGGYYGYNPYYYGGYYHPWYGYYSPYYGGYYGYNPYYYKRSGADAINRGNNTNNSGFNTGNTNGFERNSSNQNSVNNNGFRRSGFGTPNNNNSSNQQQNGGFRRTESTPSQQPSYTPQRNDSFRNSGGGFRSSGGGFGGGSSSGGGMRSSGGGGMRFGGFR